MRTKKQASKKNAAGAPARTASAVAAARPEPEVRAAVGLNGITVEGGRVNVAVSLDIPQPTLQENPKWPWSQWQVAYQEKQVSKDLRRLAQSVANLEHVSRTVGGRAAARAASRPVPAAVAATAQSAGGPPA